MGFIKLGLSTIIIFAILVFIIASIRCAITYRSHGRNIFNDKDYREMYYKWLKENFLSVLYVSYSFLFYPVIFFASCLESFESEYKAYIILSLLCGKAVLSIGLIDKINKEKIKNKDEAEKLKYKLEKTEENNNELRIYNSNLIDRNMQLSDRIELLEKIKKWRKY